MVWVISLLAIGLVVGWLMASLMERREGLVLMWNIAGGVVGSFLGGFLFSVIGVRLLVGGGLVYYASLLGAVVGAVVVVLLVRLIKR